MSKNKDLNSTYTPETTYTTDYKSTADDFTPVGTDKEHMEGVTRPSMSFWQDAMRRLSKDKKSIV